MYNIRLDCLERRSAKIGLNCADKTMTELGIDSNAVYSCMKSSFENGDYSKDNWIL